MQSTTTKRLQEIFCAVFDLPLDRDLTTLDQTNSPRWDSLDHVSLVAAIENEFGISLDAADQIRMTSYLATAAVLAEKLSESASPWRAQA